MDLIADRIIKELRSRLCDEIDLIFRYGSTLTDRSHRWSDVDMSYVPREPSPDDPGYEPSWSSITVLVDDILFDLYPIPWSALSGMAEWDDWRSTILRNPQVVYTRTRAVADRFAALRERHASFRSPDQAGHMTRKAWDVFRGTGYHYQEVDRLCRARDLGAARFRANQLTQVILHALVVLNQAAIDTRRMEEVLALERRPKEFERLAVAVATASDPAALVAATDALLDETRAVLLTAQRERLSTGVQLPEILHAAYPELRSDLQRAIVAAEREDRIAMQTKMMSFAHELSFHAAFTANRCETADWNSLDEYRVAVPGVPDLIELSAKGTLEQCIGGCEKADEELRAWLAANDVDLQSYESLERLEDAFTSGAV